MNITITILSTTRRSSGSRMSHAPRQQPCGKFFTVLYNVFMAVLGFFLPTSLIEHINNFFATFPRDIKYCYKVIRIALLVFYYEKTDATVTDFFDQNARLHPNKACLVVNEMEWSFKEVDLYSRRVAQAFKGRLSKGDVVGLLMTPRAQYPCIWLGLGRIGVVTALFNTNQKNKTLIHSIAISKPKAIIFSPDMFSALFEIVSEIDSDIELYCLGKTGSGITYTDLQELIANSDPDYAPSPKLKFTDTLLYIFTSGSTGLPKAALIPHCRFILVQSFIQRMIGVNSSDRIYCPLPLYHASGGVIGVGVSFIIGGTTVIREKFSASNYFKDCIKYNCTLGQYIGETARYMLDAPESVEDKIHSVRMMFGNGIQSDVWEKLYTRFNVPDIFEFYGSTEGNIILVNTENIVGPCGYLPRYVPLFRKFIGIYLIKADENGVVERDSKGLCLPCQTNEPGLAIGMIKPNNAVKKYYGYVNQEEANNKKYVLDVFKKGDRAFSSGDILMEDHLGYIYFKDRVGDTFRWKGENVATTEVEHVIRGFPKLIECTVYGVQIPGNEGRAGMVAILDPKCETDLVKLLKYIEESLPRYAVPVFVRLVPNLELTGSYKVQKFNLKKQGYNPNIIKDPVYYKRGSSYELITLQVYDNIIDGKIKF